MLMANRELNARSARRKRQVGFGGLNVAPASPNAQYPREFFKFPRDSSGVDRPRTRTVQSQAITAGLPCLRGQNAGLECNVHDPNSRG